MELGIRPVVVYGGTTAMVIVIFCCYGLYRVTHGSRRIVCIFDNRLSTAAQKEINDYIQIQDSTSLDGLDIQSKFVCLDSLHIRVMDTATVGVQCVSCQPLVKIQDNKVVISSGRIVPQSLFDLHALNECGSITVCTEVAQRTSLLPFEVESLYTVASHSDTQFAYVWHKPTEIYCFDKVVPFFVMLVKASLCDGMKEDYLRVKGMHNGLKRGKYAHCVDMRFANQHVFRQMDRGSYEEKIVC